MKESIPATGCPYHTNKKKDSRNTSQLSCYTTARTKYKKMNCWISKLMSSNRHLSSSSGSNFMLKLCCCTLAFLFHGEFVLDNTDVEAVSTIDDVKVAWNDVIKHATWRQAIHSLRVEPIYYVNAIVISLLEYFFSIFFYVCQGENKCRLIQFH